MTNRRGFLGSLLALAAAPAMAGFRSTPVALAISPKRYTSVLDFGADPSGWADSTAAFQAAIDHAMRSGETVRYPSGRYRVSKALRYG